MSDETRWGIAILGTLVGLAIAGILAASDQSCRRHGGVFVRRLIGYQCMRLLPAESDR